MDELFDFGINFFFHRQYFVNLHILFMRRKYHWRVVIQIVTGESTERSALILALDGV